MSDSRWLDTLLARNSAFRARITPTKLPVTRTPGKVGLITCMDPRINPEGIGVEPFRPGGECESDVRISSVAGWPAGYVSRPAPVRGVAVSSTLTPDASFT